MDRVALITAGGSGMGAAAAKRLAADGFRVGILSSSGKGEALATELGGVGVTGSNQSIEDLQRLVDAAMAKWGRIDALVNSAGHGPRGASARDHRRAVADRHGCLSDERDPPDPPRRADHEGRKNRGAIVNISTAWVFEPSPMFPTSAVFRAGLAAFTKLFADQYAKDNVRMNNVLPGWIDSLPETAERREGVPMGRYGTSEEIAATIAFLSRMARATSPGRILRVDGGLMRSV